MNISKNILLIALLVLSLPASFTGLHAQGTGLVVTNSNNVGIGTTTPASDINWASPALDISGTRGTAIIRTTSANGIASLRLTGPGANHIDDWHINMRAGSSSTLNIAPQAGILGDLFTITNTGNVGIGTTTPGDKLSVSGFSNYGGIRLSATGSNPGNYSLYVTDNVNPNGGNKFGIYDQTSGLYRLIVDGNGNVGIGTTSPSYKLDVAGQVHATSFVSATTTYADFVFNPNYKLPPLSQVEAVIKQDGHLPGIPSEEEAKAHGIDLAQMQVKLLQKIEELTLHQIEQEKQMRQQADQLNKRIDQLEKENAELREKLTR